jgi:hypothetical protein
MTAPKTIPDELLNGDLAGSNLANTMPAMFWWRFLHVFKDGHYFQSASQSKKMGKSRNLEDQTSI